MHDLDQPLRTHLLALFRGGQAFETLDQVLGEVPPDKRYETPPGCGHSAWHELEHLRRSIEDILEFIQNEAGTYREKNWPADYWPTGDPPPNAWEDSYAAYQAALLELERLVDSGDLFTPFPWGDGQTLLREILLAAEHSAYHIGQIVLISRILS